MIRPSPFHSAWYLLGLVACTNGRVTSNYALQLVPRVPLNQAPFDEDTRMTLRVAQGSTVDWYDLGRPHESSPEIQNMGPLDNATIGLAIEGLDGPEDAYDPNTLRAYGEAGPFSLSLGREQAEAHVLVAEFGAIGELDLLPSDIAPWRAAIGMTPEGDVWLLGGTSAEGKPLTNMLRLTNLNTGDWSFDAMGTLPRVGDITSRIGATATFVDTAEGPALLIAGGGGDDGLGVQPSSTAFLLDLQEGTMLWSDETMRSRRAHHLATRLENNRILLFGGHTDRPGTPPPNRATYEIFNPEYNVFNEGPAALDVPASGSALANLGPDGVVVCGGSIYVEDQDVIEPSSACARISALGYSDPIAMLPIGLQFHAMAPLEDGRVLVCGGVEHALSSEEAASASDTAWVYDPEWDTWTEVEPMHHARAHHVLIPTLDGRVVVVGGAASAHPNPDLTTDPVRCTEVFDPASMRFAETGCTSVGAGAAPTAVWNATGHAFVLSGDDPALAGARAYGVVGRGPSR